MRRKVAVATAFADGLTNIWAPELSACGCVPQYALAIRVPSMQSCPMVRDTPFPIHSGSHKQLYKNGQTNRCAR